MKTLAVHIVVGLSISLGGITAASAEQNIQAVPIKTQTITGHIIWIEPSYMPDSFTFQMDNGIGVCPVGSDLQWKNPIDRKSTNPAENVKATYASALSASANGQVVEFIFNEADTACFGQFLHVISAPINQHQQWAISAVATVQNTVVTQVWIVNTQTGQVKVCYGQGDQVKPKCSPAN